MSDSRPTIPDLNTDRQGPPDLPTNSKMTAVVASMLDAFETPAVVIDRQHRIIAANGRYRGRFAGGGSVTGQTCHQVSHASAIPCDAKGESCPLRACARSGLPETSLHTHFTPDGEQQEEIHFYPMRNGNGGVPLYLEFLRPTPAARRSNGAGRLVGHSRPLRQLLRLVERVSTTETAVLLLGESGTGKELVAQKLHASSPRADGPFVPLDCSGLNESLFESELFGHEKGAFTGAVSRKPGLVESARNGTLFLDEIGDIPLGQQVKLLRLLETGTFRPVGGIESRRADFRLICATHRDLKAMIAQGTFRADLYYRISAFPIQLPALRDRIDDLPELLEACFERIGPPTPCSLTANALDALRRYDFPGNVRELINVMQRACLLAQDHLIRRRDLPEDIASGTRPVHGNGHDSEILTLAQAEERYLAWALDRFDGNHRLLAAKLGVSERTLYRRFRRLRRSVAAAPGCDLEEPSFD